MAVQNDIGTRANPGVNGSHEMDVSPSTTPASKKQGPAINDIPLNEVPAYTPGKKLRVVTIGAGYSGLTLAHKLRHQHPEMEALVDHTIYEARHEIGGTWLVNTYPGVVCDVPSHIYVSVSPPAVSTQSSRLISPVGQAFPFDPNTDWDFFYSSGPEIWKYMRGIVDKWNLDRDVKLNHRVIGAYWQEDSGQWKVEVQHGEEKFEDFADILISGQGFLK